MVLAFAGDSTMTSLVPRPLPLTAAPLFPLAAPSSPFSEAAAVFPAALLLAGTLFPTSHQRHGPSTSERAPRRTLNATPAASTIRGATTNCPSPPLSLQPG